MDRPGEPHPAVHPGGKWAEQVGRGGDPSAAGGPGDGDAAPADHPGRPAEREVVGELGLARERPLPGAAPHAGDRPDLRRTGRREPPVGRDRGRVAPAAGASHIDRAADEERPGGVVEMPGRRLADVVAGRAAPRAGPVGVGRVVDGRAGGIGPAAAAVAAGRVRVRIGRRLGPPALPRPVRPRAEPVPPGGVERRLAAGVPGRAAGVPGPEVANLG